MEIENINDISLSSENNLNLELITSSLLLYKNDKNYNNSESIIICIK